MSENFIVHNCALFVVSMHTKDRNSICIGIEGIRNYWWIITATTWTPQLMMIPPYHFLLLHIDIYPCASPSVCLIRQSQRHSPRGISNPVLCYFAQMELDTKICLCWGWSKQGFSYRDDSRRPDSVTGVRRCSISLRKKGVELVERNLIELLRTVRRQTHCMIGVVYISINEDQTKVEREDEIIK
jgi:hypothetical protein